MFASGLQLFEPGVEMEEATPPPEPSQALPDLPDAHEIIEGLFVGNADAAAEATTGPNSRNISHILDAAGCVTPAVFAALARALAEEEAAEEAHELREPPAMSRKPERTQSYWLNGIETLSAPLDDHGRTELSEDGRLTTKPPRRLLRLDRNPKLLD